ncbi:ATP synthase mitochondrial F1 complex assembly factor 1-like isoform X2 [Montipora foliosa]|uniref:ATP synthase mitochondrial F1 complex assembly factor 1-like isoform X2 n=1 Tax=Montipora foliosa TaxID=591990 RepID=UPI0035F206D4
MAATMRVRSLVSKFAKGNYFQRLPVQISAKSITRLLSSSRAVYFSTDGIESNPFYEKYAERIKVVRNEIKEGRLEEKSAEEKFRLDTKAQVEAERFKKKIQQKAAEKLLLGNKPLSSKGETSVYGEKTLSSIMHLDKIANKSAEEIRQIWREYHREKDCISAAIPSDVYNIMEERFLKFPLTRGENAPWSLAMRHFTDLRESKGIVLMVGEVDTNELSVLDAQWLAYQVQMFYASENNSREEILKTFNQSPDKFDHMSVINELSAEIQNGVLQGSNNDSHKP